MPDWTRSMQQSFEFMTVDPVTWGDKEKLTNAESCSITRDLDDETKGSATIKCPDDLSDKYVRVYLVTTQDGVVDRIPLGTHIYQTPSESFNGRRKTMDQDGYTALLELKENPPPIGYSILSGTNIMEIASRITADNVRVPVVPAIGYSNLIDNFVANTDDTWLTFLTDLIDNDDYEFDLDELGRIIFSPYVNVEEMMPIWEYSDDDSSILYPEIETQRDLYSVPNVVEVVYSPQDGDPMTAIARNDDPDSVTSTVSRGREITYRETSPNVVEGLTQAQLDEYAEKLLKDLSSIEYQIHYTHGYCPVRVGDCVLINYQRAGFNRVKAKVIRQVIKCEKGCSVEEVAVFTKKLYGGD